MEIKKVLPDPDLHYGIAPDEVGDYFQKAPQRPRKARRGDETKKMTSDTTFEESGPVGHSSGAPAYESRNPLKEEA